MNNIEPGIYTDLTNEQYHSGAGISKSGLDLIDKSPANFLVNQEHKPLDTATFKQGRAIHASILEPDVFKRDFVTIPEDAPKPPTATQLNAKKPSDATLEAIAYWEAFNKENEGKTIIGTKPGDDPYWQPSELETIERVTEAVWNNPDAFYLIERKGLFESSAYWNDPDTKVLCRCRPDFWAVDDGIVVDLKTTSDISDEAIQRSIMKFRYHVQEAFYTDGLKQAIQQGALDFPEPQVFAFIFVEVKPPYSVKVFYLDEASSSIGRADYLSNLATYANCLREKKWPKQESRARQISLPRWYMNQRIYEQTGFSHE